MKGFIFILLFFITMPFLIMAQEEEIIVYASLTDENESQLLGTTVIQDPQENMPGYFHFQDISRQLVNFSFSGEGSRSKYFQIRGIGEREQYQGAPNASVGFIIDEIDLTGIAMASNLYGIKQVELLRGSQSTINGANALAGMVYLKSDPADDDFSLTAQLQVGDDQLLSQGLSTSFFSKDSSLGARLVSQKMSQDGYMDNQYYRRDDTNARDEAITRVNLTYEPSDRYLVEFNIINADLDNGYDAWSNENTRLTQSDFLGRDTQDLLGFSLINNINISSFISTRLTYTKAESDMVISYDGDWGNQDYWSNTLYDFTSVTDRKRKQDSLDWLIQSSESQLSNSLASWLIGLYVKEIDETNQIKELYNSEMYKSIDSDFNAQHTATYGKLNILLTSLLQLDVGFRVENYKFNYLDSNVSLEDQDQSNTGGSIKLTYDLTDSLSLFAIANKGYKFGGINISVDVPNSLRAYGDESLLSFEIGMLSYFVDGKVKQKTNIFFSKRKNQQISTSYQLDPQDPLSFIYITDNASEGMNNGIETQWSIDISERVSSKISLGLLDAEFKNYDGYRPELEGRQQAYAPSMQFSSSFYYQHPKGYFGNIGLFMQSEYYYDDSHDNKGDSYKLIDVGFGYAHHDIKYTVWIKNALNQRYATRGFYFANDPNDLSYTPQLFTRLGDPRQIGFTLDYSFR
jgi:iron complex outermembrane recepter protein